MKADKFLNQVLEEAVREAIKQVLPKVISELIANKEILLAQEFIPINETIKRYNLSRRTLYNYHHKGHITLRSTEGKTYVSLVELEIYIKNNPLKKDPNMKLI